MALTPKKVYGALKAYVNGVALNGVPVNTPQIDGTTKHWLVFNPVGNTWTDTGIVARGVSPKIDVATGHWFIWDETAGDFVDSGIPATGPQGEVIQLQMNGRVVQYKFATQTPNVWTDLYEFPTGVNYVHTQTLPADVWMCQHNLGGTPVTILAVDDTGEQIVGQIDTAMSTNNLLVYRFSEPISGKAYIKF